MRSDESRSELAGLWDLHPQPSPGCPQKVSTEGVQQLCVGVRGQTPNRWNLGEDGLEQQEATSAPLLSARDHRRSEQRVLVR